MPAAETAAEHSYGEPKVSRPESKRSGSAPHASPAPMMAAMSPGAEVIVTMAPAPTAVCAPMSAIMTDPGATVAMALDSISAGMSARISKFKVVARRRGLQREEESGKRDRRRRHFSNSHSGLLFDRA